MSNNWIDIKEVELQLQNKDTSILDDRQVIYCISDDYQYCVFLRYHQAWYINNEGWRDANTPPRMEKKVGKFLIFLNKMPSGLKCLSHKKLK